MERKTRERVIERLLHRQVEMRGGTTRKLKGRVNDCDRLVIWPRGAVHFVECKAPGKKARQGQLREHKRLHALGCKVYVLDTLDAVRNYVYYRGRGHITSRSA